MKTVSFFPAVEDPKDLAVLLTRATWYLWPWRHAIKKIRVWGAAPPPAVDAVALGLDPAIDAQYGDVRPLVSTHEGGDDQAAAALLADPGQLLFVWRAPRNDAERALVQRVMNAARAQGGVTHIVDPNTSMNEGSLYLWGCLHALGDEAARVEECVRKFEELRTRVRSPHVRVFGTGPSLSTLTDYDFSGADAIVCNSIVANESLLDRTQPIAVAAGDPIFHAGCSQYAADFRAKLRHVLQTRDIFFVTVMRDYVQHLAQLPEHLHHKVIAIPFGADDAPFHYRLDQSFHIAGEGNVLSLLLLPLGGALYDRITICGCDGRPLTENKYFWAHDKASQLSADRMSNIQRVHPAFFVRSYDDHYSEHCADIARIVDALEEGGKRVDVLTPSHIPALAARQCWDTRALAPERATKRVLLVSVNPDATDDYGHWIWYDRRLSEQARKHGVEFLSLANRKLREDVRLREGHFRPAFAHETWGAGNKPIKDISLGRLKEFEATLLAQAARIGVEFPEHDRVYYLYTGSLPHALAMYRAARANPDAFFVVNTFWTCVMDCLADDYAGQWSAFLREAEKLPNLRIFAITRQIKTIFRERAGVNMPLLPHPTPSMKAPRPAPAPHAGAFRVLLPGGMTEQKGFQDIPAILEAIRTLPSLGDAELVVRATDTAGVIGGERAALIERIAAHAALVNEVMDDETFLCWLSAADVAVLPYRPEHWVYRNSALIVDLLYLGVPLVCARGTWLADVLEQLGGGLAVDGDDPGAYALAVEAIRQDRERYALSAINAARHYHAANEWALLFDSVLSPLIDPAARMAPPADLEADKVAPIQWWEAPPAPLAQPVDEPEPQQPIIDPAAQMAPSADLEADKVAPSQRWETPPAPLAQPVDEPEPQQPIHQPPEPQHETAAELEPEPAIVQIPPPDVTPPLAAAEPAPADAVAPDETIISNPTPPSAPADETLTPGRRADYISKYIWNRLTRSPRVIAAWALGAIFAATSVVGGEAIDPIRLHLAALAAASLAAAAAMIATSYCYTHRERLHHRLSQRMPILSDIATAFVSATLSRGALVSGAMALSILYVSAWLLAYAQRLTGGAAQWTLDLVFWGGGALIALIIAAAIATRLGLHVAKRALLRNNDRVLAQADDRIQAFAEQHRAELKADIAAKLASAAAQLDTTAKMLTDMKRMHESRFTRLEQNLDSMETIRLTRLERALAGLNQKPAIERLEKSFAELHQVAVQAQLQRTELANVIAQMRGTALDISRDIESTREEARRAMLATEALQDVTDKLSHNIDEIAASLQAFSAETAGNIRQMHLRTEALDRQSTALERQVGAVSAAAAENARQAKQTTEAIGRSTDALEREVSNVSGRLTGLEANLADTNDQIAAMVERQHASERVSDATDKRVETLGKTLAAVESSGFHVVNRHLTTEQLTALARHLSEAFDLQLTAPMLGYMAHRVRELEARSDGRIAAPMSDMLVRIAALLAVKRQEASLLEIGTLFGIGPLAMHAACRTHFQRIRLTFLDPLSGYYGGRYGTALADLTTGAPVTRETLEHNINVAGIPQDDVRILQFYSEDAEAIASASEERFDVLIIDGDHSYDAVMRDYADYGPLVRKNGFIIFDDYEVPEWHGVTEAVNSILENAGDGLQRVIMHGKTLVCRVRGKLAEAKIRGSTVSRRDAVS